MSMKRQLGNNTNEDEAKSFLAQFDKEFSALLNENTIASWNYVTNLTDHNAALLVFSLVSKPLFVLM